jgi:HEAT repeat protein
MPLRLAAARTLGSFRDPGLAVVASRLAADSSPATIMERVLAVALLEGDCSPEAAELLRKLAQDSEPAVAAAAYGRLLDCDPALTYDLSAGGLASSDVKLRRTAARTLVSKADAESVSALAALLDDPNRDLRRWAARSLAELTDRADLKDAVVAEIDRALAGNSWRSLEQAMLLAVTLDRRNHVPRAMELLRFRRPEVAVAASFALRRFAIPDTLPELLAYADQQHQRLLRDDMPSYERIAISEQHTQLFQLFAVARYAPSDGLLRKFVPKEMRLSSESRAAACWALGYLHAGQPDADLARQFVQRIEDIVAPVREWDDVRRMSAISLGRMKAESTLPVLRKFAEGEGVLGDVGEACWWSLEQMTGVTRPTASFAPQYILDWFLRPQ